MDLARRRRPAGLRRRPRAPARPCRDVERAPGGRGRLLASHRRADPAPGRAARPVTRASASASPTRRTDRRSTRRGRRSVRVARPGGRDPGPARGVRGPLALLLALIEARQLDVLTVPLGALADAYLDALATLEADRLGNISAFVAVASQLILIKSRAMLPRRRRVAPARSCRGRARPRGRAARAAAPLPRPPRRRPAALQEEAHGAGRAVPARARRAAVAAGLAGARPADAPPLDAGRSWSGALDGLARIAPPPPLPPETMARTITLTERAAIIREAISAAPVDRAPGPPARRPRPGRRGRHVPGDARADEAARDRRQPGRCRGARSSPGRRRRTSAASAAPRRRRRAARRDRWSRSRDRRAAANGLGRERPARRRSRPTDVAAPPPRRADRGPARGAPVRRRAAAGAARDRDARGRRPGDRRRAPRRPRGRRSPAAGSGSSCRAIASSSRPRPTPAR